MRVWAESWGHWEAKFLMKGEEGSPSHLFLSFLCKARGGKRRREKSHYLGERRWHRESWI